MAVWCAGFNPLVSATFGSFFFTNKNCYSEASTFIHVLQRPLALLDPWFALLATGC